MAGLFQKSSIQSMVGTFALQHYNSKNLFMEFTKNLDSLLRNECKTTSSIRQERSVFAVGRP